jgi:hypothetical protein
MAKILIDNIQLTGTSFFADDERFISELSDREMQVLGGDSATNELVGNFSFGGLLDSYFDNSQLGAFLQFARDEFAKFDYGDFAGSGTQPSQSSGSPGSSSGSPFGGCSSFRPSPYAYGRPCAGYYGRRRRSSSC